MFQKARKRNNLDIIVVPFLQQPVAKEKLQLRIR